jgi:site-specific DNA-methyltransferase (adenine-specific)
MKNISLPRLDEESEVRSRLLRFCRLSPGEVWTDGTHRVACGDATNDDHVATLIGKNKPTLAIHDPPYNLVAFKRRTVDDFTCWCLKWIDLTYRHLQDNSALYVWLGADQNNFFQPLPQFMLMMQEYERFAARSFITMRNQRGYGTQSNWMAVRQELLYYTKGSPYFAVQYTDIPKILRGYYKEVKGKVTENMARSKSTNIRPGNVWVDIQQVFYRMQENVSGCYAQKPIKCIERIIKASSRTGDCVLDLFAHSGTTLIASAIHGRKCLTLDIDPLFCEVAIRRLEHYNSTGHTGWQSGHAFESELGDVPDRDGGNASTKEVFLLF